MPSGRRHAVYVSRPADVARIIAEAAEVIAHR